MILIFGASAVVAASWTLQSFWRADYLTASITAGGAIFLLGFALMAARGQFQRVSVRGSADAEGTVVRPDPIAVALIIVACAAVVPSGLLYVVYVPRGVVDLSLSRGEQIFSPILIGILVAFAAGPVISMAVRRDSGHLRLTPDGFENAEMHGTRRGEWDNVTDGRALERLRNEQFVPE